VVPGVGDDLVERRLTARLTPAGEDHTGIQAGEIAGNLLTDAGVRAGDDGRLPGEVDLDRADHAGFDARIPAPVSRSLPTRNEVVWIFPGRNGVVLERARVFGARVNLDRTQALRLGERPVGAARSSAASASGRASPRPSSDRIDPVYAMG
jgi:hypothetical protein